MATPIEATKQPVYQGLAGGNEGGVGYVRSYTGPSGTVPIGDDPDEGEPLTGVRTVHVWAEISHVSD